MDTRGSVPNQIHINPNAYHDAYQLGSVLFPNVDLPISLTNGFHLLVNDHQLTEIIDGSTDVKAIHIRHGDVSRVKSLLANHHASRSSDNATPSSLDFPAELASNGNMVEAFEYIGNKISANESTHLIVFNGLNTIDHQHGSPDQKNPFFVMCKKIAKSKSITDVVYKNMELASNRFFWHIHHLPYANQYQFLSCSIDESFEKHFRHPYSVSRRTNEYRAAPLNMRYLRFNNCTFHDNQPNVARQFIDSLTGALSVNTIIWEDMNYPPQDDPGEIYDHLIEMSRFNGIQVISLREYDD